MDIDRSTLQPLELQPTQPTQPHAAHPEEPWALSPPKITTSSKNPSCPLLQNPHILQRVKENNPQLPMVNLSNRHQNKDALHTS